LTVIHGVGSLCLIVFAVVNKRTSFIEVAEQHL
jgi:hypothetical protein